MFNVMEALARICAPGDRREAVEQLMIDNDISYEKVEYQGDTVNFIISFGSWLAWDKVYGAHYDRVDRAPGANDNGASVVCLLRLAVQLQQEGYEGSLAFVLFDKEEPCNRVGVGELIRSGSEKFGEDLANFQQHPSLFVILDVIGYGDTMFIDPSSGEDMASVIETVTPLRRKSTPGSDNILLQCVGIESVLLCVLPHNEFDEPYPMSWAVLHTPSDSVETVDPDTVDWVQQVLHALLQEAPGVVQSVPLYEVVEESNTWDGRHWEDY